jgi:hypothetical protein
MGEYIYIYIYKLKLTQSLAFDIPGILKKEIHAFDE